MMLIFYTLFLVFIIVYELYRDKTKFIDFLTLFNLYFVFIYIFPAIVFLYDPEMDYEWRFLAEIPEAGDASIVLIMLGLAYFSVLFGFYLVSNFLYVRHKYAMYFVITHKSQILLAGIYLSMALVAFMLYAYGQGGVMELVYSGKDIRAGRQHAGVFQYARIFANGLVYIMLVFYAFWLFSQSRNARTLGKYLFVLAFVFALLHAVGTAGRGNIGLVLLLVLFVRLNVGMPKINRYRIMLLLLFSVFVFILVRYGKSLIWTLYALQDGLSAFVDAFNEHQESYVAAGGGVLESVIGFARNFDHSLVSIYTVLQFPDYYQTPRLFFDWGRAIIEIVPGITQPDFVVTSTPSALNRDLLGAEGYVPPGWVAMKLMNGGILWLVFGSVFAGMIGMAMQRVLEFNWKASPVVPAVYIMLGYYWKDNILGPDPFMVFTPNIMFFFLMIGFLSFIRLKIQGKSRENTI